MYGGVVVDVGLDAGAACREGQHKRGYYTNVFHAFLSGGRRRNVRFVSRTWSFGVYWAARLLQKRIRLQPPQADRVGQLC